MTERNPNPWLAMSDEARNQYWASLALRYAKNVGARTRARLLQTYGSAYAALQNLPDWKDAGVSSDKAARVADGTWREHARKEWENAQNLDAQILMWHDADFPPRLKELSDAPILLYLKGDISLLKAPALAIVGARNCSGEGLHIAGRFAKEISNCGITIVSGMAYGVDNIAHIHALQGIGKSIGILGAGIDVIYPEANTKTYVNMRQNGLLISEFPPHATPNAINFPIRNRIISGLSLGILVIEASIRSGSLITARQALEQNREVYAIPGTMFSPNASGCQELIRQGARAVFCVEDIIRDLERQLIPYNISADTAHENNNEQINLDKDERLSPHEIPEQINTIANLEGQKNSSQQNIENNNGKDIAQNKNSSSEIINSISMINMPNKLVSKDLSKKMSVKRPLPQGDAGLIIDFLANKKSCHIDELSIAMSKSVSEMNSLLIELEIDSWIIRSPGAIYSIAR